MKTLREKKKRVLILIFFTLVFIYYIVYLISNGEKNLLLTKVQLKNIFDIESEVENSYQRIFFLETHVEKERSLKDPRQACSVESAALMNPNADIFFLFTTNYNAVNMESSELFNTLIQYPNIHFNFVNPIEISKRTLAEDFFRENKMKNSKFPLEHMADVIRVLVLNKFGGQYLDLDLFSLVPLSIINKENFACTQSGDNYVANGIMNLNREENGGRAISNKYLEFLNIQYVPFQWDVIGPSMFTQAIKEFCPDTTLAGDKETICGNFTTFPSSKCYSIGYPEWQKIFQKEHKDYVLSTIEKSKSYFFHVWNGMRKFDHSLGDEIDSDSAYMHLAKIYCPRVYEMLNKSE